MVDPLRRWLPQLMALAVLAMPELAQAQFPSFSHVVRPGETLASIAQRYYGEPRREAALVAENGLEAEGGSGIVVGMRLTVPTVAYHRVAAGETWASIAEHYYGETFRAFVVAEANQTIEGSQPPEGAQLLIPYPLRHVADQRDTIQTVSAAYGHDDRDGVRAIRQFNQLRSTRLTRGQVILVPLADLTLSPEGQRIVQEASPTGGPGAAAAAVREVQERVSAELPDLQAAIRAGRFAESIALGNRLLGAGELTGNQIVTIHRALAVAYVAIGRSELAVQAFVEALARQPDLELDSRRTSPTVLAAFDEARRVAAAPPAP